MAGSNDLQTSDLNEQKFVWLAIGSDAPDTTLGAESFMRMIHNYVSND